MNDMVMGETLVRLGCSHLFHKDCIDEWYATLLQEQQANNEQMTCPMCRQDSSVGDSVVLNGPPAPVAESTASSQQGTSTSHHMSSPSEPHVLNTPDSGQSTFQSPYPTPSSYASDYEYMPWWPVERADTTGS